MSGAMVKENAPGGIPTGWKHRTDGVYISSRGDGVGCLVCGVLIYSVTCEGPQFSVNNIKHGCVMTEGGCNGGGPALSNSWAEFKLSSLSIIVDHIRLFMAVAHTSAPSCRIMCPKSLNHLRLAPATQHWAHCAPNTPTVILSQHSRTYKEPHSSLLLHNCVLKWNPPFLACFFFFFSDLLWKLWGTELDRTTLAVFEWCVCATVALAC